MQALKYTFFVWFALAGCFIHPSDLNELESIRVPYPHYEVSDIFGVAKLIRSLVKDADQLKKLFERPADVLKAALLVGSIVAIVKISLVTVKSFSAHAPSFFKRICKQLYSRCMQMLNMPEGFEYEQLVMWEQTYEQIVTIWCEQNDNVQVNLTADMHWEYQRQFVQQILRHLISYFESHQQYYRAKQLKRGTILMTTHIDDNQIDHVCFLIQTILASFRHLIVVAQQAEEQTTLDAEHVKKVMRSCVILMKKLCIIVGGEFDTLRSQHEYSSSSQLYGASALLEF